MTDFLNQTIIKFQPLKMRKNWLFCDVNCKLFIKSFVNFSVFFAVCENSNNAIVL